MGGFFNITAPDPVNGIGGTPISEVQMLIGVISRQQFTSPRLFKSITQCRLVHRQRIDISQHNACASWSIATLYILNANGAVTMIGSPIKCNTSPSGWFGWLKASTHEHHLPRIVRARQHNKLPLSTTHSTHNINAQNAGHPFTPPPTTLWL